MRRFPHVAIDLHHLEMLLKTNQFTCICGNFLCICNWESPWKLFVMSIKNCNNYRRLDINRYFVFVHCSCITWIFSSLEVSHIFQWLMGLHAVLGHMLWWYIIRRTVWFTLCLQRHDGLHSMQLLMKVWIISNGVFDLSNQLLNFSKNWGMQGGKI